MRYCLLITKTNHKIEVEYMPSGFVKSILFHVCFKEAGPYIKLMELLVQGIEAVKATTGIQVCEVPEDLSFDNFWNSFGFKVGKKERVIKVWQALSDAEKTLCLQSIPRYKKWLSDKNVQHLYPETYINQRRWENEYR